jgi:hypothetical protein
MQLRNGSLNPGTFEEYNSAHFYAETMHNLGQCNADRSPNPIYLSTQSSPSPLTAPNLPICCRL